MAVDSSKKRREATASSKQHGFLLLKGNLSADSDREFNIVSVDPSSASKPVRRGDLRAEPPPSTECL